MLSRVQLRTAWKTAQLLSIWSQWNTAHLKELLKQELDFWGGPSMCPCPSRPMSHSSSHSSAISSVPSPPTLRVYDPKIKVCPGRGVEEREGWPKADSTFHFSLSHPPHSLMQINAKKSLEGGSQGLWFRFRREREGCLWDHQILPWLWLGGSTLPPSPSFQKLVGRALLDTSRVKVDTFLTGYLAPGFLCMFTHWSNSERFREQTRKGDIVLHVSKQLSDCFPIQKVNPSYKNQCAHLLMSPVSQQWDTFPLMIRTQQGATQQAPWVRMAHPHLPRPSHRLSLQVTAMSLPIDLCRNLRHRPPTLRPTDVATAASSSG